jgi:predicted dinucleotide-binding enzyme
MRIAIIGMGSVGSTLGRRWHEVGHEVTFGARDPSGEKAKSAASTAGGRVKTLPEAAGGAEVIVLAVPWGAVKDALAAAGDLTGKVLLDCTNPLKPDYSGLEVGQTTSAGEHVSAASPGARVVKIFNTTGAGNMNNPRYGEEGVTMLYAGDDDEAKAQAAQLARDLGFDPVDVGPLSAARLLEPLALLWITLAFRQGLGVDFALQVLRRPLP